MLGCYGCQVSVCSRSDCQDIFRLTHNLQFQPSRGSQYTDTRYAGTSSGNRSNITRHHEYKMCLVILGLNRYEQYSLVEIFFFSAWTPVANLTSPEAVWWRTQWPGCRIWKLIYQTSTFRARAQFCINEARILLLIHATL